MLLKAVNITTMNVVIRLVIKKQIFTPNYVLSVTRNRFFNILNSSGPVAQSV
jgi:hypothetical protein